MTRAYSCKLRIDFSRRGKPTDNAFIETFNGSLRDECLNMHWFGTVAEGKATIEAWRRDDNESRPHVALGHWMPAECCLLTGGSPPGRRACSRRRLTLDPDHQSQALHLRRRSHTIGGPLVQGQVTRPAVPA